MPVRTRKKYFEAKKVIVLALLLAISLHAQQTMLRKETKNTHKKKF